MHSLRRFCTGVYDTNYKATIGVDFFVEKFEILGKPFKLHMFVLFSWKHIL